MSEKAVISDQITGSEYDEQTGIYTLYFSNKAVRATVKQYSKEVFEH
jgi:hypothetical protein